MAWESVHLFECPTRVYYGRGAVQTLPDRLGELGLRRLVLVSDHGLEAAGAVERVAAIARAGGAEVLTYTATAENPTTTNLAEIVALYGESSCDGLIGLGGGSSMDAAKAASMLIANGGSVWDYRGRDRVPVAGPPVVCIPTTCGTGAEVTFVVVITDPAEHFKIVCASRNLAATVAIVDPELVVTAPRAVIAATAMDALAHATESYVNIGSDPVLDGLNIRAIAMIGASVREAVASRSIEPVAQVTLAATMTGIAFNMNANAIVHAASTPVTAHHGVPHGVANAIFLADGLDILRPACESRLADIGAALSGASPGADAAGDAVAAIVAIRRSAPTSASRRRLRAWGLDPAEMDIPRLVTDAMQSRNIATNPLPIGPTELTDLYQRVQG